MAKVDMKGKIIIERYRTVRYRGVSTAAKRLGVNHSTLSKALQGFTPCPIGRDKMRRIEIKDITEPERMK